MISIHNFSHSPVTSQSINSPAIVRHKISEEARIHWFLGLRQAELFVQDRLDALRHAHSELKLSDIKKRRLEIQIEDLKSEILDQRNTAKKKTCLGLDIEEKQIELDRLILQLSKVEYQVRDAVAELEAANEMLETISLQHREEIENMNFEELQAAFGVACIEAKQAHALSVKLNALLFGDSIADILSSIDPSRLEAVFANLTQLQLNLPTISSLVKQSIPAMPEETK